MLDRSDEGKGIPMANGKTRKPKHVLGKREPRAYTYASECVSWRPDEETGELVPYKFGRKVTSKPGKTGLQRDADGKWFMVKREA